MQKALDTLIYYTNRGQSKFARKSADDEIVISATDLYIRFLVSDSLQYYTLKSDTGLVLFDYPLDYEITRHGDYYQDPQLSDNQKYFYTVVKPSYKAPKEVPYQLLNELFIVQNSPYYSEEILIDTVVQTNENARKTSSYEAYKLSAILTALAFDLTGNGAELNVTKVNNSSRESAAITNCSRACIFGRCFNVWCNTEYRPDGYIRVNTPNGEVGVAGLKVKMSRWFTFASARTDANGYYITGTRFPNDIINNNLDYGIDFECSHQNNVNKWAFGTNIGGAYFLWTDSYNLGRHSPNGHTMAFHTNSSFWGRMVCSNAIYKYINQVSAIGLTLPPGYLKICDKLSDDFPLLNNHLNYSIALASDFWGTIALVYQYTIFGGHLPDLLLRFNKDINRYNEITTTVWHELTHASHLQRLKNERGIFFASEFWTKNVYRQASNFTKTGQSYGKKGDADWEKIALSEGWAIYKEWRMD